MAFSEPQPDNRNEVSLTLLFSLIWAKKLLLIVLALLSIPFSLLVINYSQPLYVAESVVSQADSSSLSPVRSSQQFSQLTGLFGIKGMGGEDNKHISILKSEAFVKRLIDKDSSIDKQLLMELCQYRKPPKYSLTSLLIFLNVSELKEPTLEQSNRKIINCVKSMFEITYIAIPVWSQTRLR